MVPKKSGFEGNLYVLRRRKSHVFVSSFLQRGFCFVMYFYFTNLTIIFIIVQLTDLVEASTVHIPKLIALSGRELT